MAQQTLIFGETDYIELWGQGYPQENFNARGEIQEATRTYWVSWDSRQQAVLDFLGTAEAIPFPSGANTYYYLSRSIPHSHADYKRPSDQAPYLYADGVSFEPAGIPLDANGNPLFGNQSTIGANETPEYGHAKMTVHYAAKSFRVLPDSDMPVYASGYNGIDESSLERYCEILSHPAAEYLSVGEGTFNFGSAPVDVTGAPSGVNSNKPALGSPGKIVGTDDLTILWRQVPRRMVAKASVMAPVLGAATQQAAFDYAIGRVNQSAFLGFPPETLLCEPMEIVPWIQADGEMVFDVTFHFKYLCTGHNYYLTKDTSENLVFSQLTSGGTNYTPGLQADGVTTYDSYLFKYLFFGYDFSAGKRP